MGYTDPRAWRITLKSKKFSYKNIMFPLTSLRIDKTGFSLPLLNPFTSLGDAL
jgi:hypothetical protein